MQYLPRQGAPLPSSDSGLTNGSSSVTSISNSTSSITSSSSITTSPLTSIVLPTLINSTVPALTSIQTPPPSSTPDLTSTGVEPLNTNLSAPQTAHNDASANVVAFTSTTLFLANSSGSFPTSTSNSTENISTIVSTQPDGQITSFTTHLPTNLAESKPGLSSSKRSGIIAGATAAFVVVLCLILALVFAYRKHKLRRDLASYEKKREGKGLLDGEEFDDDEANSARNGPSMRSVAPLHAYKDFSVASSSDTIGRQSMLRTRVSESGSIFREEIWPPPELVDPIKERSSQVNLGSIVLGVMGPDADASSSYHKGSTGTAATNPPAPLPSLVENDISTVDLEPRSNPFQSQPLPLPINYLPPGALRPSTPGAASYTTS